MSLPELIDSMEVAGTVDLRGTQVLPLLLQVVGTPSDPQLAAAVATLQDWVDSGAHRIDRDQDGQYDHPNAVQIMDAWWPRLLEAEFKPEMGAAFFDAVHGVLGFDNEPNNHGEHLGSAYQGGWWGYVSKDLRRVLGQPVADGFSRTYCGSGSLSACRDALRQALADALAVPASDALRRGPRARPASSASPGARPARATSGASTRCASARSGRSPSPTIHWINRPTYQQAVEIQGHRDRGYAAPAGREPAARLARAGLPGLYLTQPQHGPPLAFGSCNPPAQRSDHLTVGTPDANGNAAQSVGLDAARGVPRQPVDPTPTRLT